MVTRLEGRSEASCARALAAGMQDASFEDMAAAALVLSIVPPAAAAAVVEELAPLFAMPSPPPLCDANACNPQTKRRLAARVAELGGQMVDGAIIGPPPSDTADPRLYLSGEGAEEIAALTKFGIDARVLKGPLGAAAALKMCYGAINKGVVGLAAAMMLAAERAGASDALREEMAAHMPDLFKRYQRQVPDMLPKAYRWVAEMREIAGFLADDPSAAAIYEGLAGVFEQIAGDVAGEGKRAAILIRAVVADQG